jgi:SPX domain protein involved in polyphosphate accumulation
MKNNGQWTLPPDNSMEDFAKSYVEKYNSELMKTETSTFIRYEDKYILPKTLKKSLVETLEKNLQPDYPDKKTKFNTMKSVYFDSSNLDMIKHHLSKATSRFKIRTREYAPDGKLSKSDFTYLEVKAKHGMMTDKFRIKVPNDDMTGFKKGLPIIPSLPLIKANPHIGVADLVKRVQDVNNALTNFNMHPSCEITYNRRAYNDGLDNGLRVTFDENVKHNILDVVPSSVSDALAKDSSGEDSLAAMVNGYDPENHMILEIKHQGSTPDWLNKFLNDHKVVKASFSKYCHAMAKHSIKNNRLYNIPI